MSVINVNGNLLTFCGKRYQCAIGKSGFTDHKHEGDGGTPLGSFYLRECWYRADRLRAPHTRLPVRVITEVDGWCDDAQRPEYNRHVTLPFVFSHERLWREDHVYDVIVPLSYNDDPVVPGLGSAIFMHVAREHYEPTEGCIALAREDLLAIVMQASVETVINIAE